MCGSNERAGGDEPCGGSAAPRMPKPSVPGPRRLRAGSSGLWRAVDDEGEVLDRFARTTLGGAEGDSNLWTSAVRHPRFPVSAFTVSCGDR